MRILTAVATGLFAVCLPLLLLTASIWWAANSHWLYTSGFARYGVTKTTGLAESQLDAVAAGLIDYFNSPEEFVGLTVTERRSWATASRASVGPLLFATGAAASPFAATSISTAPVVTVPSQEPFDPSSRPLP